MSITEKDAGLAAPTGRPHAVELMGLTLDCFTPNQLIAYLVSQSQAGHGGYVITPNVDILREVSEDPALLARVMGADIRVADGVPLIWASRIKGTPLPARVAGSDLIISLSAALASSRRTLFLLGGEPGIAERARDVLCQRIPDLNIVGTHCPPRGYEHDAAAMDEIRATLTATKPDFVYLGLPFQKTINLAIELRDLLPQMWSIEVGISLSFVCGDVSRAPRWMQILGLEWIHRLAQEPRRLAHRYLISGIPFVVRLLCHSVRARLSRPDGSDSNTGWKERSRPAVPSSESCASVKEGLAADADKKSHGSPILDDSDCLSQNVTTCSPPARESST
jgi:N-acetylglucosaminyldiphosphoundecaprenol N-acetyl-beta-D-mannosaminyltransferase